MADRTLEVRAKLQDTGFARGVRQLIQHSKKLSKPLLTPWVAASKAILNWKTALLSAVGVGGMGFLLKRTAESGRELELWADKLGISVEKLTHLRYAAEQNGYELETMVEGLKTLQERMDDAARGTRTYADQFARLGVRVTNTDGTLRNVVDVLPELSRGFQRVAKNGVQDLVLITEDLIGGSENLLSVWLTRGPEAIEKFLQRAQQLGIGLDRQFTGQANRFLRAWDEVGSLLNVSIARAFQVIEPYLTTGLSRLSQWLSGLTQSIPGSLSEFGDMVIDWAAWLYGQVASWTTRIIGGVLWVAEQIANGVNKMFVSISNSAKEIAADLVLSFQRALAAVPTWLGGSVLQPVSYAFGLVRKEIRSTIQDLDKLDPVLEQNSKNWFTYSNAIEALWTSAGKLQRADISKHLELLPEDWHQNLHGARRMTLDFIEFVEESKRRAGEVFPLTGSDTDRQKDLGFFETIGKMAKDAFGGIVTGAKQAWEGLRNMQEAGVQAGNTITNALVSGLSTGLADYVQGIKSAKEAWRDFRSFFIRTMIEMAARLVVLIGLQALFNALSGGFSALFGSGAASSGSAASAGFTPVADAGSGLYSPWSSGPRGPTFSSTGFGSDRPARQSFGRESVSALGAGSNPVPITINVNAFDSQDVIGALSDPDVQRSIALGVASRIQEPGGVRRAFRGR